MYVYMYIYIVADVLHAQVVVDVRRELPVAAPIHIQIYIYIYIYIFLFVYLFIYIYYIYIYIYIVFDSASLPFKFLNRLPGGCSGGEGTSPETLKCLTPNPYS